MSKEIKAVCDCGNDITTMKTCKRKGMHWYCKKCGTKVTRKKLDQLVENIKENW